MIIYCPKCKGFLGCRTAGFNGTEKQCRYCLTVHCCGLRSDNQESGLIPILCNNCIMANVQKILDSKGAKK